MDQQDPHYLRSFLADRDVPCPGCGYNLRNLTTSACPECNQPLELRVGLSEPRLGPWIGALSGLLSGGGGSLICLLVAVAASLLWGPPPRRAYFVIFFLPLIGLAVHGGLALALVRPAGRSRFRSAAPGMRTAIIVGCWLLPLVFVVIFVSQVR